MHLFHQYHTIIASAFSSLQQAGALPSGIDIPAFSTEPPRDASHGDIATNIAMLLAKPCAMKPRDIAELFAETLKQAEGVAAVEIAGPGFINLRLSERVWHTIIPAILHAGTAYGHCDIGAGEKVNVEYVSANPTGPMHIGHARGAVFGDVLAQLLQKCGYQVTKEYYINDAGGQIETLARSAFLRYREALGEDIGDIPAGLYPGEYLIEVGQHLAHTHGKSLLEAEESIWLPIVKTTAVQAMMELIKGDLAAMGVQHDVFTSEQALRDAGAVDEALAKLEEAGLLYTGVLEPPKGKTPEDWEPTPQLLFRSTQFGDDSDRAIKKSNGDWSYFAPDIAYHWDKYRRGHITLIDVLGADHGGYVSRIKAATAAVTGGKAKAEVHLAQLVRLTRGGEPVKMSKRAGTFVTAREVVDEVGAGVLRFIMLTRKNDMALDFDLVKVREQSKDNPVFYVQYAHARGHSVLRNAAEDMPDALKASASVKPEQLACLTDPDEVALVKLLASWPRTVELSGKQQEPHRIAFYLQELAAAFHGLWNKGSTDLSLRFLRKDAIEETIARLAMVRAVIITIAAGLDVFGVEPVEEMR